MADSPANPGAPNAQRLRLDRDRALLGLVAFVGIAIRVWVYRGPIVIPNGDEGLVGVMVRHFVHGHLAVFSWARPYGGTQEMILTVPVFWLTGTSLLGLRIIPILFSILATFFIWRVGLRTIGRRPAAVAAGLFWVWPPFNYLVLLRAQGFYASDIAYCGLLLLLALRVVEKPDLRRVALWGFVFGLAYWQTAQIVPIAFTTTFWMIWKAPRCLRHAWAAVITALVGAAPWVIWNIGHGFESLQQHPSLDTFAKSMRILISPILAMTVGLRAPYSAKLLIPSGIVTWLIYVAMLAVFLWGAWRFRHTQASLFYAIAIVFPFLYAIPRKTSYITGFPQYTTVLTPVLALLFAQVATRYWRAVAVFAVAIVIALVSIPRMEAWVRQPGTPPGFLSPRSFQPLAAELDQMQIRHVFADYWIAWRLNFDMRERIVAVENWSRTATFPGGKAVPGVDPTVRWPPFDREVRAASRVAFVYWTASYKDVTIVPALKAHGYKPIFVGPWVIFAKPG
jgi:hypothetical protein